jgi:hypothetical protein
MPDITAVNLKAVDVGTEGDVRLREPAETVDGEQIVPAPAAPPAAPEANPVPAPTPQPPVGPADTPADAPAVLPAPPDTASVSPEPPPPASFRLLEVKLDADSGQQPLEMRVRIGDAPDAIAGPLRSRWFLSRQHRLP